jgi:hypothetical protein
VPVEALRARFPAARIVEADAAMAGTIERLSAAVDRPDRDAGLALDLRGTEYETRVWNALREIPAGRTATYGDIAAKLGAPRDTREVGEACAANTDRHPGPLPPRGQKGWRARRLSLGLQAQACVARPRTGGLRFPALGLTPLGLRADRPFFCRIFDGIFDAGLRGTS